MSDYQMNLAFEKFERALISLELMANKPVDLDRGNIDATIQRFEFTIELFWKLLKRILDSKGVDVRYPKDVLRESFSGGLIHNETVWLSMLEDRNQTSHTYDEALADEIYKRIKTYVPLFKESYIALQKEFRG